MLLSQHWSSARRPAQFIMRHAVLAYNLCTTLSHGMSLTHTNMPSTSLNNAVH